MSIIGEQIKKHRIAKGITQEQLGQLVGVTTQAVSKWERGGTPDAELLPALSEILSVSIDALFGREDESLAFTLARKLSLMPDEEIFKYAFDICWAMIIGILHDATMPYDVMNTFIDLSAVTTDKITYTSKLLFDQGIATARISQDLRHFFLMTEPENGITANLSDIETLRNIFAIFAEKKLLSIIFYMHSRLNTPIATSLISKNTNLTPDEVDKCMDILCDNKLATKSVVATADGEIFTYMFHQESSVIPLLCIADEIAKKDFHDVAAAFERTKPLLG